MYTRNHFVRSEVENAIRVIKRYGTHSPYMKKLLGYLQDELAGSLPGNHLNYNPELEALTCFEIVGDGLWGIVPYMSECSRFKQSWQKYASRDTDPQSSILLFETEFLFEATQEVLSSYQFINENSARHALAYVKRQLSLIFIALDEEGFSEIEIYETAY